MKGILAIGVDSNQNYLHPGTMLTSMLKRVDLAAYDAIHAGTDLETGINVMGLSNGGVGYALDEFNESLVSAEMKASRWMKPPGQDRQRVSSMVHDYMSATTPDPGCDKAPWRLPK
jgi:basic membrane protein A